MPTDLCPVCDRAISDHPDGLACCPCGGRAVIRTVPHDTPDTGGAQYVECATPGCGMTTPLMFPLMDDVSGLLAERWNRRAPHAETERLRAENERLKARVSELVAQIPAEAAFVKAQEYRRKRVAELLSDNEEPAHD